MPPFLRNIVAVLVGAVVALAVVSISDLVVGSIYPMPAGTDMRDAESMSAAIAALPASAMVLLVLGWAIAAGIGAFVAVRISAGHRMGIGLGITGLLLLATIGNLAALPHPVWMWPAALVLIPLLGWGGARAASSRGSAS
jgi:hypothetical protein